MDTSLHPPHHAIVPTVRIGGVPVAVLDRASAASIMLDAARDHGRGDKPLFFTSANGEVIARIAIDTDVARLFALADQIVADGQPMVVISRFLCREPLPERVATTDLFHDAARLAQARGHTFYMLGASASENARAVANVRALYPDLRLLGHCHGFLEGAELDEKLAEIDALAPDVLWLALGVPREQRFFAEHGHKLPRVGLIKTSGGLFNFLSGTSRRAPKLLQTLGLEWAHRLARDPRRLGWRYLSTNPLALFLMLTRSR